MPGCTKTILTFGPMEPKGTLKESLGRAGELRNLDQALLETAADIGRLNLSSSRLERDVELG